MSFYKVGLELFMAEGFFGFVDWLARTGKKVFVDLIRNKREEWDGFKAYVTPYELDRYLPLL